MAYTQGINKWANFCFLPRQVIIFLPRLSAISCFLPRVRSAKNDFLAETVRVFVLPADSRRQTRHIKSIKYNSPGRKQEVAAEAKYDGQSQQEAKTGGRVYTLRTPSGHRYVFVHWNLTTTLWQTWLTTTSQNKQTNNWEFSIFLMPVSRNILGLRFS